MIERGPWKIKTDEQKYKNPWIEVTEYGVVRPDGKDGIFGVVEMIAGTSVLPIDDEGNVYLTKEFRFALNAEAIEALGGGMESNETPLEGASRELLEESGIEADEWIPLGTVHPFTTAIHSPSHLFMARKIRKNHLPHPDGTEQIELLKIPFAEALEMAFDGRIVHAPSCVLIFRAHHFLQRESAQTAVKLA